jgi:hypothetical protein
MPYNPDPLGAFIENLVGGARAGYDFRTEDRQRREDRTIAAEDRKRRNLTADEEMTMSRARELRAAAAGQLDTEVNKAQLQRGETADAVAATHRTAVARSAERIRRKYGNDPRYGALTHLPDEELVQRFGIESTQSDQFTLGPGQWRMGPGGQPVAIGPPPRPVGGGSATAATRREDAIRRRAQALMDRPPRGSVVNGQYVAGVPMNEETALRQAAREFDASEVQPVTRSGQGGGGAGSTSSAAQRAWDALPAIVNGRTREQRVGPRPTQ